MTMAELHVRMTTDGHNRLRDFADDEGCTVSALLEELSRHLGTEFAGDLATGARRIAAQRRRRPQLARRQ